MAIEKRGTPNPIKDVTGSEAEFERMKTQIAADNNLKRCTCGQLLAKFDQSNQTINVQRKNLDIIAKVTEAQIKCPGCAQINKL